jgi:anti-anti-sigma factor
VKGGSVTTSPLLAVAAHAADDGSVVLFATGDIDLATVGQFREAALAALVAHRPTLLVIDLGSVSFLDLAGVSALIEVHRRAAATGAAVVVRDPQPIVRRVLDLTGVLPTFCPP